MRAIRVVACVFIVAAVVLRFADAGLAGNVVRKPVEAETAQPGAADRAAELEQQVEKLARENLVLRQTNVDLSRREMDLRRKVAELEAKLTRRPVVRIQPPVPAQPGVPKGAIPREFNGEPYYIIPLEAGR